MGDPLFVLLAYRLGWIPEGPGKVWLQLYERSLLFAPDDGHEFAQRVFRIDGSELSGVH